ncbi:MAG: peptidase S41 [Marinilabiliales bacterium]|nr:MAG: peptidase S41 [Marinilabiliales bacterium]
MKNNYKYIIGSFVLIAIVLFSSCEKIAFEKEIENTPESNFYYLWNEVNERYAFLEYKSVNLDSIYTVYAARINNDMSEDSLFNVLGDMLNELRDGHVNLFSSFNVSLYDITMLGPVNVNTRILKENYLGNDYYTTGGFVHDYIANGEIGYIRFASFAYSLISTSELYYILNRYKDTKGLIIDLRQNGGGYVDNVFKLLSVFSDDERLLYQTQIKDGPEADDFSLLEEVKSTPSSSDVYAGKIAVLIDRGSYSATSFFSVCTYAYDDVFLVGDTTGGGLGLPNGGQLPNGWNYRFSITRTIAVDGNNYENGVPPDYTVILSDGADETGIDNIIEFAVEKLLE